MIKKRMVNGLHVESYDIGQEEFNLVCDMIGNDVMSENGSRLEDSAIYVESWISNEDFDKEYREWLRSMLEKGADIYTFVEGWQQIAEVAIW